MEVPTPGRELDEEGTRVSTSAGPGGVMKRCRNCGQVKNINFFPRARRPGGTRGLCKTCLGLVETVEADLPKVCPNCGGQLRRLRIFIMAEQRLVDPETGRIGRPRLVRITTPEEVPAMQGCTVCNWKHEGSAPKE